MEHNATVNGDSVDTVVMEYPITHGTDFPGMRAAHDFANISELILLVGDDLPDEDLPRLCLVNKKFNGIFSQLLYRDISLDARILQPKVLAYVAGNPRFAYTKILSLDKKAQFYSDAIPGFEPRDGAPWATMLPEWMCDLVQKTATDVLRKATNLHTINLDSTRIGSDKAVLIINNGFDGKFEQPSTKLQSLTLNLSTTPSRELSVSILQQQRLKCLCLTNIPTQHWRMKLLCQILKASPGLRYLELSYLNGTEHQWALEEICKRYKQLGGAPLELEVLILGQGVDLRLPARVLSSATGIDRSAKASYLSLLTDPAFLREIRITSANELAWATFDASFFPKMEELYLCVPVELRLPFYYFLMTQEIPDFLRQVHFHVDGTYFETYDNFEDMTENLFPFLKLRDAESSFAPKGFSFHSTFPLEYLHKRSTPLPLPETRCLDTTIHYRHLVSFVGKGLSEMSALEYLSLDIYVYVISEWDDEIGSKQLKALNGAAETCPNLRYIRLNFGATGPVFPGVTIHSCSAEIIRKPRPGSPSKKLYTSIRPLDEETEKPLRPRSLWTEEEKKSQYVEEDLDELVDHKPLWMK